MIRLFFALSLPDAVTASLAELPLAAPGVRLVPPENYHLTLRFVGEVDEATAEDLHFAVARRFSERPIAPMSVALSGLGFFGDARDAMMWIGAPQSVERLRAVHRTLETVCQATGLEAETRTFVPHVTLAKARRAARSDVERLVIAGSTTQAGPWLADRVTLYQSHLGRHGPAYEVLADYPLTGPMSP